jgi:hypothetical protein
MSGITAGATGCPTRFSKLIVDRFMDTFTPGEVDEVATLPYVAFLVKSKVISATEVDAFAHAEYVRRGYQARLPGFEEALRARHPEWTGCLSIADEPRAGRSSAPYFVGVVLIRALGP